MNSLGAKGGIERVTIVKANALADMPGNEVAICFTDLGEYPITPHPLHGNIKVFFLNTPYWEFESFGLKRLLFDYPKKILQTKRAIISVINSFQPDVMISTGSYEKFACALIRKKKTTNGKKLKKLREFHFASTYRKLIATSRSQRILANIIFGFEKYILSHFFDCTYLLTQGDLNDNYTHNILPIGKISYQYNPCSFTITPDNNTIRDKTLLAVGRICPIKNFDTLIEIWSMTAPSCPGWKLKIIGGGQNDVSYLYEIANQFGVIDRVDFPGWSNNIPEEMCKASVYCLTSLSEGFNLSMIEAMHFGLPLIAWDFPYGPAEIIKSGVNGILTPYKDKEAMAKELIGLLNDPDTISFMSKNAIKASKNFEPATIAQKWMAKFESC